MPLPEDFYDDDKNYRIRMCGLVEEMDFRHVVPNSTIHPCDSCSRPIWVNTNQNIPEADVPIDGDVAMCSMCVSMVQTIAGQDAEWLGPSPDDIRNAHSEDEIKTIIHALLDSLRPKDS